MITLQNFHKKAFITISITGFAVIFFFLWLQLTGRTQTVFNDYVSLISGAVFLISAIICFIYYKNLGDRGGVSVAILATGVSNLLFFAGNFLWGYYNLVEEIEIPYPSLADVFFILMPVCYAVAVGALLLIYRLSAKFSTIAVAVLVFLALISITLFTIGKPEISSELPFWENFFNFAYSFSDSLYVGLGVSLLIIAGGKIYKGILAWVLGMFLMTAADFVFTHRAATEVIWNGDISDQLYTLSAIVFTYAVILLAKITDRLNLEV